MWISTAYAQGTGIFDQNALVQFLPLILIFVVFYFLLIRPQQRKAKDQKAMLEALRRGDRVVTGGGIIGTVARVDNPEEVIVDIADNVRVRVLRSTITSVLAKPDPAAAREAAKPKPEARAKVVQRNNGFRDEPAANPHPPSPGGLGQSSPALRERMLSAARRMTGSLGRTREK
jgi:preprotein translocase subunit YajC